MEELTPELERRIQVEELWGRRVVLEDTMNAWRFREYQSRRLLCLIRDESGERPVVPNSAAPDRTKARQPARHLNLVNLRRAAVLGGLVLFTWFVTQQAGDKLLTRGLNPAGLNSASSPHAEKPRTEARISKGEQEIWKHPTEVRASKLRPLDADLKRIFGSSL